MRHDLLPRIGLPGKLTGALRAGTEQLQRPFVRATPLRAKKSAPGRQRCLQKRPAGLAGQGGAVAQIALATGFKHQAKHIEIAGVGELRRGQQCAFGIVPVAGTAIFRRTRINTPLDRLKHKLLIISGESNQVIDGLCRFGLGFWLFGSGVAGPAQRLNPLQQSRIGHGYARFCNRRGAMFKHVKQRGSSVLAGHPFWAATLAVNAEKGLAIKLDLVEENIQLDDPRTRVADFAPQLIIGHLNFSDAADHPSGSADLGRTKIILDVLQRIATSRREHGEGSGKWLKKTAPQHRF